MTITIDVASLLVGAILVEALLGLLSVLSMFTDAWDRGFTEGYKEGRKDRQEGTCP